ncbi:unnamed protein product [Allacma fusca]|uniref:Endocuticle structural glycoprotein SgAbd-2 n=1 Tax=Allacma fusca TaxID=39272 RepID=A0A8J2K1W5_9HEXA|nr:unnamed protein product [Allacma fusca]
MFQVLVLAGCIAFAAAAPNTGFGFAQVAPAHESTSSGEPIGRNPIIPIESMTSNSDHKGVYNFRYKSGDGSQVQVSGDLKNMGGPEGPVNVKRGSYSFNGTDNKIYTVNWVADENGFRATGDHLPTPPPMPEAISRSIDLATLPAGHHLQLASARSGYQFQNNFPQFGFASQG